MQNRPTLTKPNPTHQTRNSNSNFSQNSAHSESTVRTGSSSHTHAFQSSTPFQVKSQAPSSTPVQPQRDDLARVFNTAVVSTQAKEKRDFSSELYELTESSSFKAILNAVRQLSRVQGISERQASEQIIHTFRKMDSIWGGYVSHEGLEKLRSPGSK